MTLFLTPEEAADELRISVAHLRDLTREGLVPVTRLGSIPRYSVAALERFGPAAEILRKAARFTVARKT